MDPILLQVPYYRKVLRTRPIAYWPLGESAGAVAYDLAGAQRNGAHTGVDLGQRGIGDHRTAPWYDGVGDYTNVYSAALAAAFNGAEGSLMVWVRVNAAAVWTDGTIRRLIILRADDNNLVYIGRTATDNQLDFRVRAGGSDNRVTPAATSVVWRHYMITWSRTADSVAFYADGVSFYGAAGIGVWAGALAGTTCVIGAINTVPANVFHGWLAHGAVWPRALAPAEVAALARVR